MQTLSLIHIYVSANTSARHTHSNKSIIDKITQAFIDNWTAAYTHISDTVKHITAAERTNWNGAATSQHTHSNKSVLDGITSTLVSNWNSAYTHISDAIKHITATERTNWNSAKSKADAALPASSYTAADILKKLLTVDGSGSKLDADLLDGKEATNFASSTHTHTPASIGCLLYTSSEFGDQISNVDALYNGYQSLTTAMDEYNTYGYMTAETLSSLASSGMIQYLEATANGLSINTDALLQNAEAAKVSAINALQNSVAVSYTHLHWI